MGLLRLDDYNAQIPGLIQGRNFPDQLSVLRGMGYEDIVLLDVGKVDTIKGKKFRGVILSMGKGIFIEDVGLLCFDETYFLENIAFYIAQFRGIENPEEKIHIFAFIAISNKGKSFSLYEYKGSPVLEKYKNPDTGINTFQSFEALEADFTLTIQCKGTKYRVERVLS